MLAPRFTHFAAVDWSGAAGERHHGIAVAICGQGNAAPELVRPGHRWSRAEVLDWLVAQAPPATICGFDLSTSLAHADAGAYFPGWNASPPHARALWAMVETLCAADPHLGVSSFVDHPDLAAYFRRPGGREGARFNVDGTPGGRGRMRLTEDHQAKAGCQPTSNFNLVGAAQVGKASLAGMRLLHRLPRDIAVWPIDPVPPAGKVVVEIYTTIAAMAAGRPARASKIRTPAELDTALGQLASAPLATPTSPVAPLTDHAADALITAAWLRHQAARPELWHPPALTDKIAHTEGWTFGVA